MHKPHSKSSSFSHDIVDTSMDPHRAALSSSRAPSGSVVSSGHEHRIVALAPMLADSFLPASCPPEKYAALTRFLLHLFSSRLYPDPHALRPFTLHSRMSSVLSHAGPAAADRGESAWQSLMYPHKPSSSILRHQYLE